MSSDGQMNLHAKPLLGRLLLDREVIRESDLAQALELQATLDGRLGSLLVRLGALSEDQLLAALAAQTGLGVLGRDRPAPEVGIDLERPAPRPTREWMLDNGVLLWIEAEAVHGVARDVMSPQLEDALALMLEGRAVQWWLAPNAMIEQLLDQLESLGHESETSATAKSLRALAEEAPVVELVNNLFAQAVEQRASDIHLEPGEREFTVRLRIDGVLYARMRLPRDRYDAVSSRIKLMAGMDIAERRLPQDGRLTQRAGGQLMDVRVSALPGVHGESVVMRMLPKERSELGIERLGLERDHAAMLRDWAMQAHGIVLVTGPTGSGKSTTLYATLAASNDGRRKIITVEDPVEFRLPGITQVQAHADIGLTFAATLRSMLRQDPDVIMVGEIRDKETAEIAIQAALTGHLVMSTVHTNDSVGAFIRLIDMGVEPFLVATPVLGVQAQRLVRRLCPHCAEPDTAIPAFVEEACARWVGGLGLEGPQWRRPKGCKHCQGTGYIGRVGIYEMVGIDDEFRHEVVTGASHQRLRELASSRGARFLREDGFIKAWKGITSLEEVMRVTGT